VIPRLVVPEILDHLPVDDPEAQRSRRDLRRINLLMGNERWISRSLRKFQDAAQHGITEIGAGDGDLTRRLAREFPESQLSAYDLAPRPARLDPRIAWHQGDVFLAAAPSPGGVVIANLFLHHFEDQALAELGRWLAGCAVLIVNEPDRALLPHGLGRLLHPWINRVTRHDMHVSIDAGFAAGEIATALGLTPGAWKIEETSSWRGGRRVIAWQT
jgi:hypothetical protein